MKPLNLILPTIKLRICVENKPETRKGTERPGAPEDLESMVIPTEFPTAKQIAQTDAEVQGNLLPEYEQKFTYLHEQENLTKLCSNAGLDILMRSCREYTLPRSDESSQVKDRIRGNTKFGPVLEVMICYRQERYGVEINIESLFRDRTCS